MYFCISNGSRLKIRRYTLLWKWQIKIYFTWRVRNKIFKCVYKRHCWFWLFTWKFVSLRNIKMIQYGKKTILASRKKLFKLFYNQEELKYQSFDLGKLCSFELVFSSTLSIYIVYIISSFPKVTATFNL